jgi:hypothetical protein
MMTVIKLKDEVFILSKIKRFKKKEIEFQENSVSRRKHGPKLYYISIDVGLGYRDSFETNGEEERDEAFDALVKKIKRS